MEQKDKDLKERIKWIIRQYAVNDANFAQKIQTNRSTLSQCINGSNGVSKELLLKIHEAYPQISVEWLLLGEGSPTRDDLQRRDDVYYQSKNAAAQVRNEDRLEYGKDLVLESGKKESLSSDNKENTVKNGSMSVLNKTENIGHRVVKIMIFYSDNTFETYSLDRYK
ncbi:MAG: helix-turn-helix domain-containing protein [Porphyromonadaceae bacterium]|nr:helix-turn-helix domain-containing protein [Porphyromonadaceae bacterium]